MSERRTCRRCKTPKPLTKENYPPRGLGQSHICAECLAERKAKRGKQTHRKKEQTRVCDSCKKEFPLTAKYFRRVGRGISRTCNTCSKGVNAARPHLRYVDKPGGKPGSRKPLEEQLKERREDRSKSPERYKEAAKRRSKAVREAKKEVLKDEETVKAALERTYDVKHDENPPKGMVNRAKAVAEREKVRKATLAEIELAKRQLARRRLLPFIEKFNRHYQAGWVHKHICRQLERFVERVERKESPRMMIFMPPRHGKSEIASKNFPAWLLGRHPDWEIIASSYAVSLPIGFSRKIQATIQDPAYQQLFPNTKLHPKAQSAEAWMTTMEGGYVAAGVGGGITGKGAHVFIIDDPVKDAEEADSETQRDKVWDWWGSTAKTRLAPGGGVLVIQTRWNDDDLSGRLIKQMLEQKKELNELIDEAGFRLKQLQPGELEERVKVKAEILQYEKELSEIDDWEIIIYPAIAEKDEYLDEEGRLVYDPDEEEIPGLTKVRSQGEALHEDRYPLPRLRNMKRSMQPRHWSALYQQNPVPDEGLYFTKDMIRFTVSVPPLDQMYLFSAWDLAVGERQQNDYSVGAVGGLDYQGQVHILEILRFRANIHDTAQTIMSTYRKYPNMLEVGIEKGQLELAIWPELDRIMTRERLYPTFNHDLRPITDKWVRARPLQGMMQRGLVLFPHNQPWTDNAVQELLRFPGGVHDDIVDALAWLIRMIGNRKPPAKPGSEAHQSWKRKLNRILADQNRAKDPMGA